MRHQGAGCARRGVRDHKGRAEFANAEGNDLRVYPATKAESVLLVFSSGNGAVVPAVPGFLTALTFDADELVDVALEPSANTPLDRTIKRS